jgi:Tfp pilus assembly protein PilF
VRVALAVVAVVALGWLAVQQRDTVLQQRGVSASSHLAVPGNAAQAEKDFRDARLLNPGTDADVGRAVLYLAREQRPRAEALLDDVLRREPDNLTAWAVLYSVSRGRDAATARRALAARARLDPLSARRQH